MSYLIGTLFADRYSKAATETRTSYHPKQRLLKSAKSKLIGSGRACRGNAPPPCRVRPRSPQTFRKWQFPSKETLTALQALLPQQQEPPAVVALKEPGQLLTKHVLHALSGLRQSASGPSSLRTDHFHFAFSGICSDSLIRILQEVVEGPAPRWLANERLFALSKKHGGVRLIAVGEMLRHMLLTMHNVLKVLIHQHLYKL